MQKLRLTAVALACAGALAAVTPAQTCLTTLFAANNGGADGWVNMFDVNVLNAAGISVQSIEVNTGTTPVGTLFDCEVYTTPGTYVGKENDPAAWTLVATGNGMAQGNDVPTPVDVTDFNLGQGSHGVAVRLVGASMRYTNGDGTNQFYSNADIEIALGSSVAGLFTGLVFNPRVWNGTLCYVEGSECWLLGGFRKIDMRLGNDTLLVEPLFMIEMTLTNLPVIDVPPNPGLVGTSLFLQSFMYNPGVYPNDPVMLSEGLDYEIGVSTTAYGQGSGLEMWPIGQIVAQPGGKIAINFSLP